MFELLSLIVCAKSGELSFEQKKVFFTSTKTFFLLHEWKNDTKFGPGMIQDSLIFVGKVYP